MSFVLLALSGALATPPMSMAKTMARKPTSIQKRLGIPKRLPINSRLIFLSISTHCLHTLAILSSEEDRSAAD